MKIKAPGVNPWAGAALLAGGILLTSASWAGSDQPPQMPRCNARIGTLAVREAPNGNQWWTSMNLESPAALIKVYVSQSNCFTLVDRGQGLQAAQEERALAASGEERVGSNMGMGQMKAADYVLIPDIANSNGNAQHTNIGGILGGFLPHGFGAVVGGISMSKKTADVVLTLTDVRSTEQVALEQGHSDKTDIGWAGAVAAAVSGEVSLREAPAATPIPRSARWWRWPIWMRTPRWWPNCSTTRPTRRRTTCSSRCG